MSKKDEAMKLALDYIVATNKSSEFWLVPDSNLNKTVTALREALAEQPAQTDWEAVAADQAMTIALLKAEQPAQQEPLPYNKEDMKDLDVNQRLAFKLGWKSAEEAHGIKEST